MSSSLCSILRSYFVLGRLFCWLLLALPLQIAVKPLSLRNSLRQAVTLIVFKGTCKALGLKITYSGMPSLETPCLFLSNHISYLDILALGSLLKGSFVAKEEVRKWPLFGLYASLQGSLFIKRSKSTLLSQKSLIIQRLQEGQSLILFPEGTTYSGIHVLPFRSALLECIEHASLISHLKIQPISISYTHLSGLSLGRNKRLEVSWFGTYSLFPHLLSLLIQGPLTVHITLHSPLSAQDLACRKKTASLCHREVLKGIAKIFQSP